MFANRSNFVAAGLTTVTFLSSSYGNQIEQSLSVTKEIVIPLKFDHFVYIEDARKLQQKSRLTSYFLGISLRVDQCTWRFIFSR